MLSSNSYHKEERRKNQWRESKNSSGNNIFLAAILIDMGGASLLYQIWKDTAIIGIA